MALRGQADRLQNRRIKIYAVVLLVAWVGAFSVPQAFAWTPVNYWHGSFTGFDTETGGQASREYNQQTIEVSQNGTTDICVDYVGYGAYCSPTIFTSEGAAASNVTAECGGVATQPNTSSCDTTKPS